MAQGPRAARVSALRPDGDAAVVDILAALADAMDAVTADSMPDVLGALEAAKARAWARLMQPSAVAAPSADGDATVDVEEAARLLGMSRSWVYRHAARLPFARRVGRRAIRFSTSGIRRYLAARGA